MYEADLSVSVVQYRSEFDRTSYDTKAIKVMYEADLSVSVVQYHSRQEILKVMYEADLSVSVVQYHSELDRTSYDTKGNV